MAGQLTYIGDKLYSNGDRVAVSQGDEDISPFTMRNKLINGGFDIWQRGTSQTSSGYGSDDRWVNYSNISTKTHSRVACTDTERALFNASYFSRTVSNYVAGTNSLVVKSQMIENITLLSGKTVTLSFWAKADGNKKMHVGITDFYGLGGTPSANGTLSYKVGIIDLTTTWTKYKLTTTIPSIIGKTVGTDGVHTSAWRIQVGITYGTDRHEVAGGIPVGQSGTFDIAQVQLEEGSVATPFEQRPIGMELALCQRYYWQYVNNPSLYIYASGPYISGNNRITIPHPVTMRTAPTVSSAFNNQPSDTQSSIYGASFYRSGSYRMEANSHYIKCDAEL